MPATLIRSRSYAHERALPREARCMHGIPDMQSRREFLASVVSAVATVHAIGACGGGGDPGPDPPVPAPGDTDDNLPDAGRPPGTDAGQPAGTDAGQPT